MSRYYSFADFMADVVELSEEICKRKYNLDLTEYANVSSTTVAGIYKLIRKNWTVFTSVAALMYPSRVIISTLIAKFLLTGAGLIVVAVLGTGAAGILRQMYTDKLLPRFINEVGKEYKPMWQDNEGDIEVIDNLRDRAADELLKCIGRML